MIIHKANAKDYVSLNSLAIENYIVSYYNKIGFLIFNNEGRKLRDCNKAQLNQIAAEMETIKKRLEWIIEGRY